MKLTHFTNNIPASNPNLTKLWVEQTYPSEMSNGQIAERAKHSAKHHLFSMKPPTSMPAKDWWQMQESLSRAVTKEHINQALDDLDAMDSRLRDYSLNLDIFTSCRGRPTSTYDHRQQDGEEDRSLIPAGLFRTIGPG